jgi:hypothetical protein
MKSNVLFALALMWVAPANAATFTPRVNGDVVTVQVDGDIEQGDTGRAVDAISDARSAHTIVFNLNSAGGDVQEATRLMKGMLALRLKGFHVNVAVDQGQVCASACMLLFASGDGKYTFGDGHICVHQARSGIAAMNYEQLAPNYGLTVNIASALRRLGAPASVIAKQVLDDGTCTSLDANDLTSWGVIQRPAR